MRPLMTSIFITLNELGHCRFLQYYSPSAMILFDSKVKGLVVPGNDGQVGQDGLGEHLVL